MIRLVPGKKNLFIVAILLTIIIAIRTFGQQGRPQEEPPKNLKVLPKDMSVEEVKKIMKVFTKSLGVKCEFCHVGKPQEDKPWPKFEFASDDKPEKNIARKMMAMVDSINLNFISKMGEPDFEQITCVTCHMGNEKPMVSVDSLMKK